MISFLEGFAIGLGTIIFIGPVFFLLMNSTLQYGSGAGLAVTFGIIISDILCLLLCYYGIAMLIISEAYKFWIALAGAVILFGLGLFYVFRKSPKLKTNSFPTKNSVSLGGFFIKGFSINFFNVFVFVFWTGMYQYGKLKYQEVTTYTWFLVAIVLGIFSIDIIKVIIAKKIRKIISDKSLSYIFKGTGILLLFFALRLLFWLL